MDDEDLGKHIKDLEDQIAHLKRENEYVTKQRNILAYNGGRAMGLADAELKSVRADAALVVHALNCAIQLIDALIVYLPEGSPISGGVATCKQNLDQAMLQISRQRPAPSAFPPKIPGPPSPPKES